MDCYWYYTLTVNEQFRNFMLMLITIRFYNLPVIEIMATSNKQVGSVSTEEKTQLYQDYLLKSEVSRQVRDGLLKLIENKPDEPMLFLGDYFDSCTDKSSKVSSALPLLTFTQNNPSVFEANLLKAYDALCTAKPPGSKKSFKPGLIGSNYESFLKSIIANVNEEIQEIFLKQITCRNNEVVSFNIFRYGINTCFIFKKYIQHCKSLFSVLGSKQMASNADKAICDAAISSFKSALDILFCEEGKAEQFLEAGMALGPCSLAVDLLNLKESCFGQYAMTENCFLRDMSNLFVSSLKAMK